ncbi:uncharacterized protein LOC123221220 [Mangifera indica]|uniref:uncharacterized protein LOC123221220 n=1 Tax=Mangifera indica TaxID=29780 RepID=UPI001CFC27C6|nr:uncharacterized protein LOC123221220 [Mangifera indica]
MARKSNQQKNGLDHQASSHRKKGSKLRSAVPDKTGCGRDNMVKVFPPEDLPDGNHQGIPFVDGASRASTRKEKQTTDLRDSDQSVSSKGNSGSDTENIASLRTPNIREAIARRGRKHGKSGLRCLLNVLHVKNAMENVKFSNNALVRSLRVHVSSKLKAALELLERQKPLFVSLTTNFYNACDYVRMKFQKVYAAVLVFFKHLAIILLHLSMVWLDCALRGIDSFLRMGMTCFFSVIWCSILSVVAIVGIAKFLMVLVIAALVAFFIGFTVAIIVVALSGAVFLWFYGSFWTTVFIIFLGGLAFKLNHESLALLITTVYSIYCAWTYVGWLGLLLALNLSFISSDALIYFLKNNINQQRTDGPHEQTSGMQGGPGDNSESGHTSSSENAPGLSADRSAGVPSTSGADSEMTSEDEVARLLNCTDHYSALGLSRYENVDVSLVKREYKKRAMLVHPDKNMGNEKAEEAFKKLQNAYEVLLDSLKRKAYDDELRREELLNYFRSFQNVSQKNGRHGFFFAPGSARSEADTEDPIGDSRLIACKKCNNFHVWIETKKSKSRARWCQECKDYHLAKDGDGWVEQSSHPLIFGLLQKVDLPSAYVCADSKVYNANEWYICQGMRCPANTHKPSFHVNTSLTSKHGPSKGTSSGQRGGWMPPTNLDEPMTEEEFVEWFQNAVQSGLFDNIGASTSSESRTANAASGFKGSGASTSSGNKRKKKGKKQW